MQQEAEEAAVVRELRQLKGGSPLDIIRNSGSKINDFTQQLAEKGASKKGYLGEANPRYIYKADDFSVLVWDNLWGALDQPKSEARKYTKLVLLKEGKRKHDGEKFTSKIELDIKLLPFVRDFLEKIALGVDKEST